MQGPAPQMRVLTLGDREDSARFIGERLGMLSPAPRGSGVYQRFA
jgi:hypothetical protein